jgi:putative methyltransferase (TIGR04325 family)
VAGGECISRNFFLRHRVLPDVVASTVNLIRTESILVEKNLLRQITPPILQRLVRKWKGHHYIWEGIYPSFRHVPTHGPGFTSENLVQGNRYYIELLKTSGSDRTGINDETVLLPPVVATVQTYYARPLKILDFGGGLGQCYLKLKNTMPNIGAIEYHVVEMDWAVREGRSVHGNDAGIRFHATLAQAPTDVDIVYTNGVLMFFEDYERALRQLCRLGPRFILMVNIAVGSFTTFASAHRKVGTNSSVPHWFFNLAEISNIMTEEGYSLIFKGTHEACYDLSNLPEAFRLPNGSPSNLLFRSTATMP